MSENNPFIEGSEEVPEDEAAIAAKALAEEAAAAHARVNEVKEKVAKAKSAKEAALKAESAKLEAKVEAAREQVVKTVASIPKGPDKQTLRPSPPTHKNSPLKLGSPTPSGPPGVHSSNTSARLPELIADFAFAAIAITFAFLIFQDINFSLK